MAGKVAAMDGLVPDAEEQEAGSHEFRASRKSCS
jgi:hypothetical protein